jgi:hypothetical protein
MTQHHDREGRQGIPLSAVYRQLDDQPAAGAEGYDPAATVARLMTRWAGEAQGTQQGEHATSSAPKTEAAVLSARQDLTLQTGRRRLASTVSAYVAILGISGIAAAVAVLAGHLPAMALAGLAVTAVLVAYAVVLIHRATMHGMTADHDQLLSRGAAADKLTGNLAMRREQHPRPQSPALLTDEDKDEDEDDGDTPLEHRLRRQSPLLRTALRYAQIAAVATLALTTLHPGFSLATSGVIALAAAGGGLVLTMISLAATALFANERRSSRAFLFLELLIGGRSSTRRSRPAKLR